MWCCTLKKEVIIMIYDFDSCYFHDNAIHGISLPGYGDIPSVLAFDIDYIVTWGQCSANGKALFSISQALLYFHHVTDLNINISWVNSSHTTSESGVYIIDIEREVVATKLRLPQYFKWKIVTNNDNYSFSFGASTLVMELLGEPHLVDRQYLLNNERISIFSTIT